MALSFTYPWVLPFLLLAIIPFFRSRQTALKYTNLEMIPFDWVSALFFAWVRFLAAGVIFLLIFALSGPFYQERTETRLGKGAHIVLLLDRSASMNENFSGRYFGGQAKESKVAIARQMLTEFVQQRQNDLFGMISFSTSPIYVLPLTQDKEAVLAAIRATKSRGRGVTNIAPGLSMALQFFNDQPLTGSRVILLVSDGAARIKPETQSILAEHFRQNRAMLYWIYLRNKNSASLKVKPAHVNETTTPEYFLHQFFLSMGIPYQAFEAENPDALQKAIAAIGKLENKPIEYSIKIPRKSLVGTCYFLALIAVLSLLIIHYFERNNWKSKPGSITNKS